ncbi:MAG: hypothetical protein J2P52_15200 [Blastocatellia bacterium]|nr:hypothetical protein [Blastocatellia bacterium]
MKSAQYKTECDQPFAMATAFGVRRLGAALVVHWPLRQVWVTKLIAPFVSEIRESEDDYRSGTKLPHSKGFADAIGAWASIKRLAVLIFTLLPGQIYGSGEAIAKTRQVAATDSKIVQQTTIRFPEIGLVRVSALEPLNELPQIVFTGLKNHKEISTIHLGTSDPDFFKPHLEDKYTKPFLRFKVLSVKGLPHPLILAVAVAPGGSDTLFESSIIGAVNGEIRVLTQEPLTNNVQGGVYVGYLGRKWGTGAAVWNFLWEDGAHYEPHRYEVELYPFNVKTMSFQKGKVLASRRKYADRGAGALSELRLPYGDLLKSIPITEKYR